jgi:hypothetical protein
MNQGVKLVKFEGDEARTIARAASTQVELEHFRRVTHSVMQDALKVWAELWAELENDLTCGVAVVGRGGFTRVEDGPQKTEDTGQMMENGNPPSVVCPASSALWSPSCGWPEYLEKMWNLRQNLDFLARFSRP